MWMAAPGWQLWLTHHFDKDEEVGLVSFTEVNICSCLWARSWASSAS